ncbi:MAG: flagellin, partial [candidate division Zixibacteria bacterium]|nr:flagellin [candidate division Zixibacteria bacterium]
GQLGILGEEADLDVGVTSATLLSDLLGGQGIGLPPGTIRITDENLGEWVDVDLSGAVTVDDVITTINSALGAHVPPLDNLTLGISEQGNAFFFDSTENGLISGVTALDNLNGGNGIDMAAGTIVLTDDAGFVLEIDLAGLNTVGDVINKFNAAVAAAPGIDNVTMQLNAAGTGLEIVDTNAVPLGLRVVDISEKSHTAESLGIVGRIDPVLSGRDLSPVTSFSIEEVGSTTAADLGILARFNGDYAGSDLDPDLVATARLSDLNNGYGFDFGAISLKQGDMQRTIDLSDASIVTIQDLLDAINNSGLDVTASINAAGTGIQVVNDDPTRSFIIQDSGAGRSAKDFQLFGSSDMIGSLMVLEDALRADDQDGISLMLGTMDAAIQHVLNFRAAVGAKGMRLESTHARLLDMELSFTKLLSEVEDADLTKLVTDLATFENNYQASLIASAKIIQPSLLDFLD